MRKADWTCLMTKGKLDIMLTMFINISFEINSCHKSGRHFPNKILIKDLKRSNILTQCNIRQ